MNGGITAAQLEALRVLAPALDDATYLAGGVAIAVELHHRTSLDLDLFTGNDFDPERLMEHLSGVTTLRVVGRAAGTLHAEVGGVPVSILRHRYPLLGPPRPGGATGLPVPAASLEDLACMKVSAIAGRGAAKDFWDLCELLDHGVAGGDLARLLELYPRKFRADDVGHAVRSLVYFAEADAVALPLGLAAERWRAIKADITGRVRAL